MLFRKLSKQTGQRDRFAFEAGADLALLVALVFPLVWAFTLAFVGVRGCTRGLEAGLRVLRFGTTLFFAAPFEEALRATFFGVD